MDYPPFNFPPRGIAVNLRVAYGGIASLHFPLLLKEGWPQYNVYQSIVKFSLRPGWLIFMSNKFIFIVKNYPLLFNENYEMQNFFLNLLQYSYMVIILKSVY